MTIKDVKLNGEDTLPINEFKLECMCTNPSIVMIAKRGSGKSWVCRAILNHFRDIPVGLIIAPTDRMNCFYGNFFPESYIHYNYKSEIIQKLLHRQEIIIDKKRKKASQGHKLDARAFIVMDDCLSKKGTWMRDQPILELLYNGRHYEIMYILTMQYPLGITPELRGNFDYIFLLAEDFVSNLKRIYDHYAGMFPNFDSFRQSFAQLTEDYGCMVIANRGARKSFLEKVYWYRAPAIEEKTIGCKQFHKFHLLNFDHEWRAKRKMFDINEYCTKKKRDKVPLKIDKVGLDEYGEPIPKKINYSRKVREDLTSR
ncbi:MAG: packaging ATPase [Harvfovirus sp.]|uniref:Packaging ATPase n=1 Tax=Harvfovirus sp. TaxID=2487768 RepID=A0A3G5A0X6_9VIRU|nr:MAG: packaging ATPase [Harvfovirus sp.]